MDVLCLLFDLLLADHVIAARKIQQCREEIIP